MPFLILAAMMTAAAAKDLDAESAKFLDECRYIMTELEQDMFESLPTAERRAEFIRNFWKGLDPNPLTEVNEYRDLYYRRIEEANRLFTRGKEGFRTDRGKVYVLMGPPDEKESNPGGRKSDEKPSEVWIYRSAKHRGLGRDAEITFIDETGTGNYRLSTRAELDAGAARSQQVREMVPGDMVAMKTAALMQANVREDGLIPESAKLAEATPPPAPSPAPAATATAPDWKIVVTSRYDYFKATEPGQTVVAMTVSLDRATASGPTDGYKVFAKIEPLTEGLAMQPLDLKDKFVSLETDRQLLYQAQTPLLKGQFKVLYGVTDVGLNVTKAYEDTITPPSFDDGKLALSSMVIATKMEEAKGSAEAGATPALKPFEHSGTRVVPCTDGRYGKKDELSVYVQVYGAATGASGKPSLDVKYYIYRKQDDGKWKAVGQMPLPSQTEMVQEYVLPISDIRQGPGDYKIEVTVKDNGSGQTVKGEAPFSVVK